MRSIRFSDERGRSKVALPAIPDRLRDGENASGATVVVTQLKLEHHLVERSLENVRNIGALYTLG